MSVAVDRRKSPAQRNPYSLSLPSWVWDRLTSCPKAGQGVNAWLFSTARALAHFFSEAELVELLTHYSAGCGRVVGRDEILRQVQQGIRAKACGQARGRVPTQYSPDTDRGVIPVPISSIHFEPETLARLAAQAPSAVNWRHYLYERSPYRPDIHTGVWFLRKLFREGEKVLVFDTMKSSRPALIATINKELQRSPLSIEDSPSGLGAWFLANPVDGNWHPNPRDGGKLSCRSEEAVTAFRYAVLESDQACPDHWLSFLTQFPAPIAAIYTSGGRSIHALLRVDAESKAKWDAAIAPLKRTLKVLGADPAALSAVRLTRLPGCWRREKGGFQKLLYLNPDITAATPIAELPIRETREAALTRWRGCHPRWQTTMRAFA